MAGFSLDHDEALVMLTKAQGILRELRDMGVNGDQLALTTPAADDPASNSYNSQLTWNGQSGAFGHGSHHVRLELDYVNSLVTQLQKALHIIPESDQQRGRDLTRSAGSEGGVIL